MSERQFPIQGGLTVPWSAAEKAYATYNRRGTRRQTLQDLANRGGFGLVEFCMFYRGQNPMGMEFSFTRHPKLIAGVLAEVLQ